jgi:hypothetical protein
MGVDIDSGSPPLTAGGNSHEESIAAAEPRDHVDGEQTFVDDKTELESDLGRLAVGDGRSRYIVSSFWASLNEEVPCYTLRILNWLDL